MTARQLVFGIVLVLLAICVASYQCVADSYTDTMISFFARRLDTMERQIDGLEDALADTRVELAEMRGEWRGRQNATTGVAAGVPMGLAGVLAWWLRRERRKGK